MTISVDWLIGSVTLGSALNYTINGTGYSIAAGTYYLRDATAARSLIGQVVVDMTTEGLTSPAGTLTEAGYAKLTADTNFAIVWTDTALRDYLGWSGNISSTQSSVAQLFSPLFWSPGYRGTPKHSPGGVTGTKVTDTAYTVSPSGQTAQATTHNTRIVNGMTWNGVYIDRVWTTDEDGLGGEFRKFYDDVLRPLHRFKIYPAIGEDRTSTTGVTWTTAMGPYKISRADDRWYKRGVDHSDVRSPIEIDYYETAEAS